MILLTGSRKEQIQYRNNRFNDYLESQHRSFQAVDHRDRTRSYSEGVATSHPKELIPIDIAPETERLVREEILSGHFDSPDEVIRAGIEALREKYFSPAPSPLRNGRALIEACSKVRGILTDEEIDEFVIRNPSGSRPVDLE